MLWSVAIISSLCELKFSNVGSWEMDTRVLGNEWGFRQIPFHLITGFFTMYSVWLNVRTEPWFENPGFKSDSPFLTVCLRAKSLIFLSTSPLENEEITALMGFINPWNGEYTSNCLHEQVQFQQTLVELMKRFFFLLSSSCTSSHSYYPKSSPTLPCRVAQ